MANQINNSENKKSPIVEVVKKVSPSVVSIIISKDLPKVRKYYLRPFDDFFGFYGPPIVQYRQEGTEKVKIGGGSGFFVLPDGIILTNRHVVSAPDVDYTVVTHSQEEYPVEILARDAINDIAILKIKNCQKDFPVLELGDSDRLDLGEEVIAIGNALGTFQNTVSRGIVSGLSRFITAADGFSGQTAQLRGLIQTDAAINPGNSGGPLLNLEGQVIGINTAIVLGAQNIGFAIPINNAKKDLNDLQKYGRLIQPFLGVRYILINRELQERFNLPVDYGALVIPEPISGEEAVVPDSPADKIGLKAGDIILEFNQIKVDQKHPLQNLIYDCQVGQEVEIKILRGDKIGVASLKLEERR